MAATRFSHMSLAHAVLSGVVALAVIVLGFAATPARADDHEAMAGTWRVTSVDADGTLNDSDQVRRIVVVNQPNGDWTLLIDGNMLAKGTSSIDEAADPKTVDLTVTESSDGNNIGHIFKGIYELGEKTRRVCLARDGGERPTEFFSAAASGHMLVTYEKVEEE